MTVYVLEAVDNNLYHCIGVYDNSGMAETEMAYLAERNPHLKFGVYAHPLNEPWHGTKYDKMDAPGALGELSREILERIGECPPNS